MSISSQVSSLIAVSYGEYTSQSKIICEHQRILRIEEVNVGTSSIHAEGGINGAKSHIHPLSILVRIAARALDLVVYIPEHSASSGCVGRRRCPLQSS